MGIFCKVISLLLSSNIKFTEIFCCEVSGGSCSNEFVRPFSVVLQDTDLPFSKGGCIVVFLCVVSEEQ